MGDFNFRISNEDSKKKKQIIQKIEELTRDSSNPVELFEIQSSMISSKITHCNDAIAAPKKITEKHFVSAGISKPKGSPTTIGDWAVWRERDFQRLSFALFTDHYPVTAIFTADEN